MTSDRAGTLRSRGSACRFCGRSSAVVCACGSRAARARGAPQARRSRREALDRRAHLQRSQPERPDSARHVLEPRRKVALLSRPRRRPTSPRSGPWTPRPASAACWSTPSICATSCCRPRRAASRLAWAASRRRDISGRRIAKPCCSSPPRNSSGTTSHTQNIEDRSSPRPPATAAAGDERRPSTTPKFRPTAAGSVSCARTTFGSSAWPAARRGN